jgi:hypothetical protein
MIILFDNSLFFSIDCMLIHAMFFHLLLFLLEKRKESHQEENQEKDHHKRRTKRMISKWATKHATEHKSGRYIRFIVKFSLFLLILYFIP